MLPCYSKAFLAEPPIIFGRRLLPYALGHSLLLECVESPVASGAVYTVKDAALFVAVCSRGFQEARAFLLGGEASEAEMKAMGEACAGMDFAAECAKVEEYKRDSDEVPPRWESEKRGGASLPIPWQMAYFEVLRGRSAITPEVEAAIWNIPVARAIAYCAAAGWAKGDDSLMTEEELRGIQALKEHEGTANA